MELNESSITDDLLRTWDNEFDSMVQDRLEMGKRDYGSLGFVKNDVWTMAKEEVVDLANYARFLYYKISALEVHIAMQVEGAE
jgi:hypothetical protein